MSAAETEANAAAGRASPGRPVGVLAMVLAFAIAVVGLSVGQSYATGLAEGYAHAVAGQNLPIKRLQLTFQRAALADGHLLPIYGSSELYCCGDPYRGAQLFADEPTGFDVFNVGEAGTADLFFVQTFGALGGDLRGKKIVISDSPPWFFNPNGLALKPYAGNFSPEIASAFVFDAPISLSLKEAVARRMLDYPSTLADRPLLQYAVDDLADGSPVALLGYFALYPIGRVDSWFQQLNDAWTTVQYIQKHPELQTSVPSQPRSLNWTTLLTRATEIAQSRSTNSPFGFPNPLWLRLMRQQPAFRQALAMYCAGGTNRDGRALPYPYGWAHNVTSSAEWTDLSLEIAVLRELGAEPLFWSLPLPGVYDNYTNLSPKARQVYYQQYAKVTASVEAFDFRSHDEDRYFMNDTGAHFTPRGWIFAGRVLDLFWHNASPRAIHAALSGLEAQVPAVGPPPPPSATQTFRQCSQFATFPVRLQSGRGAG